MSIDRDFDYQQAEKDTEAKIPVEVPADALSPETLKAVVESFVLREGTDYGWHEVQHETKSEQVLKQIQKGHVKVIFDPNTESITLMTEKDWAKTRARFSN